MKTKLSTLKEYASAGNWRKAIGIAAKFPRLGEHRGIILDAQMAYTNPRFVAQIGKDRDALIAAGIAAIKLMYKI